jgi:GNAT superfamily N-acetyltransferase
MASTEGAREHALGPEHVSGCVALSAASHWNQNEADWALMLSFGRGYGVSLPDGRLAASTLSLPYGREFAWIAMVLVHPDCRRRGYATQLLRHALGDLAHDGRLPVLDATPAGREVYRQEGFRDTWGFRRLALQGAWGGRPVAHDEIRVRALQATDWPQIAALDAPAFGAGRESVLRALALRLPVAALVAERKGELVGYLLGRDGREAQQLGPLVARDAGAAQALLAAALERVRPPVYLDMVEREEALRTWLEGGGFAFQRPFTRMVHGAEHAPGDARLVYCPAGPELG